MPGCAKPCWIASRIGRTFWKRARNPIASAARSRSIRREKKLQRRNRAMEVTVRGKGGKPKAGFPAFPLPLETPQNRRAFHIPTAPMTGPYIYGQNAKNLAENTQPRGWAKLNCRSGPITVAKRTSLIMPVIIIWLILKEQLRLIFRTSPSQNELARSPELLDDAPYGFCIQIRTTNFQWR